MATWRWKSPDYDPAVTAPYRQLVARRENDCSRRDFARGRGVGDGLSANLLPFDSFADLSQTCFQLMEWRCASIGAPRQSPTTA